MSAPAKRNIRRRYLLKAGLHVEGKSDNGTRRIYNAKEKGNNVIHTTTDLVRKFGPEKFSLLEGGEEVEEEPVAEQGSNNPEGDKAPQKNDGLVETLNAMTVADLRKMAEEEEIDLDNATRKDEIVNVIRQAIETR